MVNDMKCILLTNGIIYTYIIRCIFSTGRPTLWDSVGHVLVMVFLCVFLLFYVLVKYFNTWYKAPICFINHSLRQIWQSGLMLSCYVEKVH